MTLFELFSQNCNELSPALDASTQRMTLKGRDAQSLICRPDSQGRHAIEVQVDRYLAVISVFLPALTVMVADEARPLINILSGRTDCRMMSAY